MVLTRRQTAAAPRPAPPRWAELPGDVLRRVAAGAQKLMPRGRPGFWDDRPVEDPPLLLRDVLSAACACGAWRRALASPDLGRLSIGGATPGKRAWMQRVRPGARHLHLYASAASQEGQALLSCVRGEAVEEAEVARVPACLPDPSLLPNVRSLKVSCIEWETGWLAALAQLPLLAGLELALAPPAGPLASQPMALPALPALRRLAAYIEPGCPPLRLDLGALPALEELELWGCARDAEEDRGAAELAGSAPSHLRRLTIDLSRVTLDCACMPALRRVSLWAQEVAGAGTLGAAAGLRRLCIGSGAGMRYGRTLECALSKPWLAEALGALPPGLGVLELQGTFMSPQVAAAASSMRSVPVLALSLRFDDYGEAEFEEGGLGPGPLWAGLKALRWDWSQPLPPALASAEQLKLLVWAGARGYPTTPEAMQPLTALPRLRRLLLPRCGAPPPELEGQLRAALPRLEKLSVASSWRDSSVAKFLREARDVCGAGGSGAGAELGSDSEGASDEE